MMTIEQYNKIERLRAEGSTIRAISTEIGVSPSTVSRHLRLTALGIEPKPPKQPKTYTAEVGSAPKSSAVLVSSFSGVVSCLRITSKDPELLTYLRAYSRPIEDEEGIWTLEIDPYQATNLLPALPAFFTTWKLDDQYRYNPRNSYL